MEKINLSKTLGYITAILFFVAAIRSGHSIYSALGFLTLLCVARIKEK